MKCYVFSYLSPLFFSLFFYRLGYESICCIGEGKFWEGMCGTGGESFHCDSVYKVTCAFPSLFLQVGISGQGVVNKVWVNTCLQVTLLMMLSGFLPFPCLLLEFTDMRARSKQDVWVIYVCKTSPS